MKKILFFAASLFIFSGISLSCSGGNSDKEKEDSIQAEMSAAPNETTPEQTEQTTEQTEPTDNFTNALPEPAKIFNDKNAGKYLESLGYKGYDDIVGVGGEDVLQGSFTLESDNKKCTVFYEIGSQKITQVTITGDKKALDDFYNNAVKFKEGGVKCNVSLQGDMVTIKD